MIGVDAYVIVEVERHDGHQASEFFQIHVQGDASGKHGLPETPGIPLPYPVVFEQRDGVVDHTADFRRVFVMVAEGKAKDPAVGGHGHIP